MVKIAEKIKIQIEYGDVEVYSFDGLSDNKEHIALAFGNWSDFKNPKVRVHSECLTGDVFGSHRCDCGPQLDEAMKSFSETQGLIIYLRQEGRGIGLYNKLKAYRLQDQGLDTYAANRELGFDEDGRNFAIAAKMLKALGINSIELLSNNPEKHRQLENAGITISRRLFTKLSKTSQNQNYLHTKAIKGGHDGLRQQLFSNCSTGA